MKKSTFLRWTIICLLTFTFSNLLAQNTFNQDTSFNSQMNQVFAPLDKSRIPFGILQDFAMELTNLAAYNGTLLVDSTKTTYGTVMDIYNTLCYGAISTNAGSLLHPIYVDSIWQISRQAGVITLGGLFYQYSSFLPNAVSSNLITVSNNQLFDKFVNGVWQNPYQKDSVFAVSPSVDKYNSGGSHSVNIVLPSTLWLTNSSSSITSLSADFADGLGFRSLPTNQTLSLTYSTGGTKTWTFKLLLTNGSTLQSRTDFVIDSTNGTSFVLPKGRKESLATFHKQWKFKYDFFGGSTFVPISATTPVYGQLATGYMTINYVNSDMKFHKPLIIVEGFDLGDIMEPETVTGDRTLKDFLQDVSNSGSGNLNTLITTGGYDIVYIDWAHGTDFIERNAMLVESVIQYVNNNRATSTPSVVIGQSMGGLAARWALRDMENNNIPHQTSLFISWDSPEQGANVPIAYQYLSRQARSLYLHSTIPGLFNAYVNLFRPELRGFARSVITLRNEYNGSPWNTLGGSSLGDVAIGPLHLQDAPAAREMLINYVSTGLSIDNSIHTSWQTTLQQKGYPRGYTGQTLTNIAVSNGSECASTESFSPAQAMVNVSGNINTRFLGDVIGTFIFGGIANVIGQPSLLLGVLPGRNSFAMQFTCNAQPDGVAVNQYIGKITFKKTILWVIPVTVYLTNWSVTSNASILPFDYFPGGEYAPPVNLTDLSYQNVLVKFGISVNAFQPSFCFIPVPSALDIGLGTTSLVKADYLTRYIGAFPPAAPKNTPFGAFTTAFNVLPNNNELHIQVSQRNGDWVYNQLIGMPTASNCSFLCAGNTFSIAGANPLCTSGTYSVQNLVSSPNLSVAWSASPTGIVSITPNGLQATITKLTTGWTTLTALISNSSSDCNTSFQVQSLMHAGGYGSSDYPISGPSSACRNSSVNFSTVSNLPGATGYSWFWPGSWTYSGGQNTPNISLRTGTTTGNGQVGVRVASTCDAGGSPAIQNVQVNSCGFAITPNPSTGLVTISMNTNSGADVATANTQASTNAKIFQVKVVDPIGTVKQSASYTQGVAALTLNLSSLQNGIYTIQVYDGLSWSSEQIVLMR